MCYSPLPKNPQNPFANRISPTVLHTGVITASFPTNINLTFALDTATLNLFGLYKNSMPLGASCAVEVAIEQITTAASWPWNLSTVPMARSGNASFSNFTWRL